MDSVDHLDSTPSVPYTNWKDGWFAWCTSLTEKHENRSNVNDRLVRLFYDRYYTFQ